MPSSPEFGQVPRITAVLNLLRQAGKRIRSSSPAEICGFSFLAALVFTFTLWTSIRSTHRFEEPLDASSAPQALIWPLSSALEVGEHGNRPVFPYSVIPGGVQSAQELQKAVSVDPVVALHYSDFNISKVRRVTLKQPQWMYVSYRVGNDVFWTKRKLALAKGETVLTDGRSMARTRCGNRISVLPVRPNAVAEPTAEQFNAPIFPPATSTPYLVASSTPAGVPGGPPQPAPGSSFVPVVPFFPLPGGGGINGGHPSTPPPPGGGGGGGGGGGSPPPGGGGAPPPGGGGGTPPPGGGGTPPPVGIPEPATVVLLLCGLGALWLVRRTRKAC